MFEVLSRSTDQVIELRIDGQLSDTDYQRLDSILDEEAREEEEMGLLMHVDSLEGWSGLDEMMEELQNRLDLFADFQRIAVVGEAKWGKWLTKISDALVPGDVQYFEKNLLADARTWVAEDLPQTQSTG